MAWQFGPYRVEGLLARGGMGEVHRAYDTRHDRVVALKLLTDHAANDEEFRKRFKREAHAAARLREPHVIPIHAYGEIDGRLYLDMRLVEGEDLRRTLTARGPLSPSAAVDIVSQVAGALDAAHAEGLVHRDVKPSNVILQGDFAYLVDFGIARPLTSNTDITGTGEAVGTVAYMAPERFGRGPTDHRVDIYALACLLFQCLTGEKPYTSENALAVIFAHANEDPPKPSERRPGVPVGLDQVVATGMAKTPADRFATAGELAAAARQALKGQATQRLSTVPVLPQPQPQRPPQAQPPPLPQPPPQPLPQAQAQRPPERKRPATPYGFRIVAAVAAVIVAAGITTAAVWFWPKGSTTHNTQPTSPVTATSTPRSTATSTATAGGLVNPPCDDSYIVIVGSAVNEQNYTSDIQQFLAANPGAKYLHAPSTGCDSLRTHLNGVEIYSVYYGPYTDKESACAKKAAVGGDSFVRRLDNTSPVDRAVSCG
ncbi:protein kinase [Kibdelosporangium persicum]|uniref:non-specific serine/threonine protein kinase n=1 Tax=Kibdelosporangium persicum TaxID=2698649 RepID=A0ABX2F7M0_9PSEU|nr:Serine/threonine-protein kinase PknH [Kibdelosporangium persicum]